MSERTMSILTIIAAATSGAIGGLFLAFSTSVMAALGRIAPASGIAAMQSINIVIQNPVFFLFFFGPALLSIVLAIGAIMGWAPGGGPWLYIGAALYLIGIIVVTMAINVPMNNALASVDPASADGARLWSEYLVNWTRWNHIRTVSGIAACVAYILALR